MKITIFALVFAATAAANAADLDKKQAGIVNRLSMQVTAAQTALDTYGPGKRQYTARLNDDFARKLGKLEEMLAPLPADNDEVKKEAAHVDAFRKALAAQSAQLASGTAAKEGEKEAITATLESPEGQGELESLKHFGEMFKGYKRYDLDFYAYSRWPTHAMVAELRGWSETWQATQKRVADLRAKYKAIAEYKGQLGGKAAMAQANVISAMGDVTQGFDLFKSAIETFAKNVPAQIEQDGAALKQLSDAAVGSKNFNAFMQNEGKIEALRYRLANLATVWGPLAPSDDERKKVDARSKALLDEADTTMEKLATLIIKENKGPKEKYSGADRGKLEAYVRSVWTKKFSNESIVAVRFGAAELERLTAWKYNSSASAFVKVDRSSLPVWVVVKDGPNQAIMWFATLYKVHTKGDELELNWIDRSARGAAPDRRLFLSNL